MAQATTFWFPCFDSHGWSLAEAHIPTHTIKWQGRAIGGVQERVEQWLKCAFTNPLDPTPRVWRTAPVAEEWVAQTGVHAALQMAFWIQRDSELRLSEQDIERASRLLPEV